MTNVSPINLFFTENVKLLAGAAVVIAGIGIYYLWINQYLPFLPAS